MARPRKVICMKQDYGSIRQRKSGGNYYFRYQVNGQRKEVSLKTRNKVEAEKKAKELVEVAKSSNIEVIAAHVQYSKGLKKKLTNLPLVDVFEKYESHPDKATPHTQHERYAYRGSFKEFIEFALGLPRKKKYRHLQVENISDITKEVAILFADHLRTTEIAVDTHNRKLKRIRKIFSCFIEYFEEGNPFDLKQLYRVKREEQGKFQRRQAFTRDQERQLLEVLDDDKFQVINKEEIRVIYYIGMFTGQRLKDCVLLQWQDVCLEQRRIRLKQYKTGKEVSIPIAPELYKVLADANESQTNMYVCPNSAARYQRLDKKGINIGANLVNKDVLRVIKWIGVEPSIKVEGRVKKVTVYGFHSLRHSFCSFCAQSDISKATLISILGTDSEIADKYYTHVDEVSQIQAIAKISDKIHSDRSDNQRIKDVLELLDSNPPASKKTLAKIKNMLTD
ncbi:tyrosine-type recombinase/integrase [Lentisphaerota bacterium WC36G]|nr:tyrosine-type recombinase/integrase [Lentisphaerae bacterium WC36]